MNHRYSKLRTRFLAGTKLGPASPEAPSPVAGDAKPKPKRKPAKKAAAKKKAAEK